MNLFLCGLRRSGTTILYDALGEDPELRCFYEPLREEAETIGGGSGARDVDLGAETRELRERFRAETTPICRSSCSTGADRARPTFVVVARLGSSVNGPRRGLCRKRETAGKPSPAGWVPLRRARLRTAGRRARRGSGRIRRRRRHRDLGGRPGWPAGRRYARRRCRRDTGHRHAASSPAGHPTGPRRF